MFQCVGCAFTSISEDASQETASITIVIKYICYSIHAPREQIGDDLIDIIIGSNLSE